MPPVTDSMVQLNVAQDTLLLKAILVAVVHQIVFGRTIVTLGTGLTVKTTKT